MSQSTFRVGPAAVSYRIVSLQGFDLGDSDETDLVSCRRHL